MALLEGRKEAQEIGDGNAYKRIKGEGEQGCG